MQGVYHSGFTIEEIQGNSLLIATVAFGLKLFSGFNSFIMATHYVTFLQQNLGPDLCHLSVAYICFLLS